MEILELQPDEQGVKEYLGQVLNNKPFGYGIEISELTGHGHGYCTIAEFKNGEPSGVAIYFRHKEVSDGINIKDVETFIKDKINFSTREVDSYVTRDGNSMDFTSPGIYLGAKQVVDKGNYQKEIKQGKGILIRDDNIYLGEFHNSKFDGFGILYSKDFVYVGSFKEDEFHGYGILKTENIYYKGEFYKGKKHGLGELIIKEFHEDWGYISGRGILARYIGPFFGGHIHGQGKLLTQKGNAYSMEFKGGFVTSRVVMDQLKHEKDELKKYFFIDERDQRKRRENPDRIYTVILDIETQRGSDECGGWFPEKMGMAIAVTHHDYDGFYTWEEHEVYDLMDYLEQHDIIVGFNIKDFDLQVLNGYRQNTSHYFERITFDILQDVHEKTGIRVKLEELCMQTLNKSKSGNGIDSIKWWKTGQIELIKSYCKDDVMLTQELYYYGQTNNKIFYSKNFKRVEIPVDWE